jgi:hypothetical protein
VRSGVEGEEGTYGYVLEGKKSAVGVEQHVQVTGADEGVVCVLDHTLQYTVLRRAQTLVVDGLVRDGITEDAVDALVPVSGRSVNRGLDVGAVKVDLRARRNVVAGVDLSELGVRVRAGLGDVVDVEARVNLKDGLVCALKLIAGVVVGVRLGRQSRNGSLRRGELEVLVEVVGVTTFIVALPDAFQEGLVEEKQVVPVLKVGCDDHFLLGSVVCNDRVVDVDALEGHIRVISSDEGVGDVRDVVTAVGFTSQVKIPSLDTEGLDELLVEANELLAELDLVGNIGCALSEANADRLLNPHHVG